MIGFMLRKSLIRGSAAVQIVVVLLLMTGCGGVVFIGFVANPQLPSTSATGRIDTVILGSVNDFHGNPLTITIVTQFKSGLQSTLGFCGDQRGRFPINVVVRLDFTRETNCLFLVNVVILN